MCPGCHNIYSQQLACDRVRSVPSFKLDPWLGLFELVQKNNFYTKWHLGRDVLAFQNTNGIVNSWVLGTTADVWMGNNTRREKQKRNGFKGYCTLASLLFPAKTWTNYRFSLISRAGPEESVWYNALMRQLRFWKVAGWTGRAGRGHLQSEFKSLVLGDAMTEVWLFVDWILLGGWLGVPMLSTWGLWCL